MCSWLICKILSCHLVVAKYLILSDISFWSDVGSSQCFPLKHSPDPGNGSSKGADGVASPTFSMETLHRRHASEQALETN